MAFFDVSGSFRIGSNLEFHGKQDRAEHVGGKPWARAEVSITVSHQSIHVREIKVPEFIYDFIGKAALEKAAANPPKKMATLEWNTEDVGDVFMSQFRGRDTDFYDPIEDHTPNADATDGAFVRGDYVLADGKKIGVATGKAYAFYERWLIFLAEIGLFPMCVKIKSFITY